MTDAININRGSDEPWVGYWNDADGNPTDLTGCTVDLFDNDLCPLFTIAITDAPNGEITLQPVWSADDAEILAFPHTSYLRIRVMFPDGTDDTTPRLTIYAN